MYNLHKFKKKLQYSQYDYVFKKFEDMYRIVNLLTLPLVGVYKICVVSNEIKDIRSFID